MTDCDYYDCGWCYHPSPEETNASQGACTSPDDCPYLEGRDNDERAKVTMELIEKYFERNRKPTLKEKFEEYLQTSDFAKSYHVIANELVDIVKEHLPREDPNPSFDTLQWNKAIRTMRERLR